MFDANLLDGTGQLFMLVFKSSSEGLQLGLGFRVVPLLLCALAVFALLTTFHQNPGLAPSIPKATELQTAANQAPAANFLNVTVWVRLSNDYGLFSLNVKHQVTIYLEAWLAGPPSPESLISISSQVSFSKVPAAASYGFWGSPPTSVLNISVPANSTRFSATLEGFIEGSSVVWKNAAEIPFVSVVSSPVSYEVYVLFAVPPEGAKVTAVYAPGATSLSFSEATIAGRSGILTSEKHPSSAIVILYEPEVWAWTALGTIIGLAVTISLISFTEVFEPSRTLISRAVARLALGWRRLITHVDSRKLLSAYLLVAMLMVSLSLSLGPDPRPKVYILAQPLTAEQLSTYLPTGSLALTTSDEMNEFQTLVTLGTVLDVVVADYVPPTPNVAETYIFPGLASVQRIVVLKTYAGSFANEVSARYPEKTTILDSPAGLGLLRSPRTGFFGISIPYSEWALGASLIGLCSLVIVLLGMASLSYKLVETGRGVGYAGLPEAVGYAVFLFVFTQIVYVVTSVLLAMPVGLHTSTSKVTVVGLMGLGGGSRPRMLAGILGFLFGSLTSLKGGLRLDKVGFLVALGTVFLVIIDPITGGKIFHEFVLLFSVGPSLEQAAATWGYVRGYLGLVTSSLGAWISLTYGVSLGITLYYAGSLPLHFLSRLGKSSGTMMVLLCAFPAGLGAVRVADMSPWKTMSSVIPGIMVGLILGTGFVALSFAEGKLRRRLAGTS